MDELDLMLDLVEVLVAPFVEGVECLTDLALELTQRLLLLVLDVVEEHRLVQVDTQLDGTDGLRLFSLLEALTLLLAVIDGSCVLLLGVLPRVGAALRTVLSEVPVDVSLQLGEKNKLTGRDAHAEELIEKSDLSLAD